ncbi:Retrovirus-related Pol polyprotein from transposon 17.6 [Gossypium australe]|uniref:Retrovirus-related Pol polyprotein from transposon 17.6 n=1 Tax=Gossypium australe TaxID=47621 RepID=A0A5B6WEP1_9ROSI|nr:Retrovirus-related Pol polyprotein from transposon 17.6 [Gossypium australe]
MDLSFNSFRGDQRCPHHGLPLWLQVQTFYNGVNPSTRQLIDSAAGGTLNNETPEAAYEFIEEKTLNNYQWQVMRTKPTKAVSGFNLDAVTMLSNQVELLNKKIDVTSVMQCDTNGGGMSNKEYSSYNPGIESEQMNYMGNNSRPQSNPYSNTNNPSWRNHPNLSRGGQGNQRQQPPPGFQQQPYLQEKKPNLEEMITKFIAVPETRFQITETALKNQQASIPGLENQLGQLANLPSNNETNPKEQLHAITAHESEGLDSPKPRQENVADKSKVEVSHNNPKLVSTEYQPRESYPNTTKKDHIDEQMPNSKKILKELLTNKRKLDDTSHVALNVVCSGILQNKLPRKLKDPGSFTIPCLIGGLSVNNALADLGASINVMPYKMFKQLGLGKPKQTRMSIYKTIRVPRDFVVLGMDEDSNVPLILGRPFLATAETKIDVGTGEVTLRVSNETITAR